LHTNDADTRQELRDDTVAVATVCYTV